MNRTSCQSLFMAISLGLVLLAGNGCASLTALPGFGAAEPPPPPLVEPGQPSVKIQATTSKAEVKRARLPYRDGMLVEDLLREGRLIDRFDNMDITVVRQLPNGHRIKMEIAYNKSKNQVEPSYNYALFPDDLVIVEEISGNVLDDLMDQFGDPLMRRYVRAK